MGGSLLNRGYPSPKFNKPPKDYIEEKLENGGEEVIRGRHKVYVLRKGLQEAC